MRCKPCLPYFIFVYETIIKLTADQIVRIWLESLTTQLMNKQTYDTL